MTTQTRFTRGPWRGSENFPMFVEDAKGCPVAVTHPSYIAGNTADPGVDCPELEECEYNGVLIASAPDLYAALEALADLYDTDEGCHELPQYVAAMAALRKARGEA